ncbi:hypothetical protein SLEP1_g57968 [Rubroshorea leprosula]|uniref:Disease resistance R13L4/SHOC-2-like LRR domain-containing protein n=1 Tax=Rubroshorea leprosula TaxID=152421 RepID=A0AAV5MP24_9ROSI|nr:hypothetical protein SLEP1_g57968 [Rubroshorea leprosula]
MVLDFARFLMGNEFVVQEVHPDDIIRIKLPPEKTHHLSVVLAENACLPTSLLGAEKLRSLSIFKSDHAEEDETSNLFIQPKHLRSLILCGAICGLLNLQSLFLQRCYSLEGLPDKIEKLVNLRCLNTADSTALTYYPKGIGRLTSLRELGTIVVCCDHNDNEKFSLGDLENLCHLRFLALKVKDGQIDANEARRAKLQSKIHLKDLVLDDRWAYGKEDELDNFVKVLNPPSHTNVKFPLNELIEDFRAQVFAAEDFHVSPQSIVSS